MSAAARHVVSLFFFFFKQKTAYEIYQCDWSSDVCSSDLIDVFADLRDTDSEWRLKEKLGTQKQSKLINLLNSFPFDIQNKYSGIIFCPHRGRYFGVTDRYRNDDLRKAVYDGIQRAAIPNLRMGSDRKSVV